MADYDFIAQGVRPLTDPTVQAHNAASAALASQEARNAGEQRKILQQQQTENDLKIQQQARAARDQDIVNEALQSHMSGLEAGKGPDFKLLIGTVAKKGASAPAVMGLQKMVTEMQQNDLKLTDEQRKNLLARHDQLGGIIEGIQALPDENARAQAWPQAIQQAIQSGAVTPEELQQLPKEYPGDKHLSLTRNLLLMQGGLAKQAAAAQETALKAAQAKKAEADALLAGAKTPGEQAKAIQQQVQLAAGPLAQALAQGPEAAAAAISKLPPEIQDHFKGAKTPDEVLAIGSTPEAQIKAKIDLQKAVDTRNHQRAEELIAKGHLNVSQANSAREDKKFIAEFGSPESRSMYTQSVIDNPDSYQYLPPQIKPGVAADLVSRGMSVPVPLPGELKNRAVASNITLAAIGRIEKLLQDPDIQGAWGPIAGRLGKLEEGVGTSVFSDPVRAQKEQQLRTDLLLLKFNEAKANIGGRPSKELVGALSQVSPDVRMATPFLLGAMQSMKNAAMSSRTEAKEYSTGGASGARAAVPGSGGTPKATHRFNPATGKIEEIKQ